MYNYIAIYLAPSILAEAKRLDDETYVGRRKTLRLGSIAEDPSVKPNIAEVPGAEVSPLLEHLQQIAKGDQEIQELVQLLKDIRTYQDHPEMVEAFEKHDHALAHGAKEHGRDVLELLVEHYLQHDELGEEERSMELHKQELPLHIKLVVLDSLKEYQEVVESIRGDVGDIAEQLRKNESIKHIRQLVGTLQKRGDDEVLKEVLEDLDPAHPAHHIFSDDSGHAHHLIAKMAAQQGHLTHEDAENYLNTTLYPQLTRHFKGVLSADRPGKIASGVFESSNKAERSIPIQLDESTLHPVSESFTPRDRIYVVKKGSLTNFAYALSDSIVVVDAGAKLSVDTLGDGVMIKLRGDDSVVEVKQVTGSCKGFRILGKNGKSLTGGPNLQLGEGVAEKLKID